MLNEELRRQQGVVEKQNKQLQANLACALAKEKPSQRFERISSDTQIEEKNERVVLLHDSLCKGINDTILRREGIATKKVWAPDLCRMSEAVNSINKTDVIVIGALTRDLDKKNVDEMNKEIESVIGQALTKAEKVVVSTIVHREDLPNIGAKAELVNAKIKYDFRDNERVIICDNYNMYDRKFRGPDKLHLTDHGTAVLATNLKHKICEALGIQVMKKENRGGYPRNRRPPSTREFFSQNYDG